jgi:chromosome segregation ATPase
VSAHNLVSVPISKTYAGRRGDFQVERDQIDSILNQRKTEYADVEKDLRQAAWENNAERARVLLAHKTALEVLIAAQEQRLQSVESEIQGIDSRIERLRQLVDHTRKKQEMVSERVTTRNDQIAKLQRQKADYLAAIESLESQIQECHEQNKTDEEVELPRFKTEVKGWEDEIKELIG